VRNSRQAVPRAEPATGLSQTTAGLAAQTGIIRGHVGHADAPVGLAEADLDLRPSGATTRTDARGFFVFRGVPAGKVHLVCRNRIRAVVTVILDGLVAGRQ
jgi:hypothetical protein